MRLLLITLSLVGMVGCESKVDVEAQKVDVEAPLDELRKSVGSLGYTRDSDGKITSLRLNSTQITDAGLAHLESFAKLKELRIDVRLDDARITDEGVKKLQEALPNCEIKCCRTPWD